MSPEFFDIFGFFAFLFIVIISLWGLYTKKRFPIWTKIVLLIIGILGLIIDGAIVYINYLK